MFGTDDEFTCAEHIIYRTGMNLTGNHTGTNTAQIADAGIHNTEVLDVTTAVDTTEQTSLNAIVHSYRQVTDDVLLSVKLTLETYLNSIIIIGTHWREVRNHAHIQVIHQANLYLVVTLVHHLAAYITQFLGQGDIVPSVFIR